MHVQRLVTVHARAVFAEQYRPLVGVELRDAVDQLRERLDGHGDI